MELWVEIVLWAGSILGTLAFIGFVCMYTESVKDYNYLDDRITKLDEALVKCQKDHIFHTEYIGCGWGSSRENYTIKKVLEMLIEQQKLTLKYSPQKVKHSELKLTKKKGNK